MLNTMCDKPTSYVLTSIFLKQKSNFCLIKQFARFLAVTCLAHLPLHPSLLVLVHAVDHAAGNEGDGHEEDNDGAHN